MNISFDYIYETDFLDTTFEYGIIKGNSKILFIKPGLKGSMEGHNNKYYILGKEINKKYGYTIVLSNNPESSIKNPLDDALRIINEFVNEMKFTNFEIYFLGISNGGVLGARYAYMYQSIKKCLLINPPLFISYHKLKDGALKFNEEKMTFIYGTLDPSYKFTQLLDLIDNDKVCYKILENKDHNLTNDIELLESLLDEYLFKI